MKGQLSETLAMRVMLVFIIYVALYLFSILKEVTNRIMKLTVINYVVLVLSFLFANIKLLSLMFVHFTPHTCFLKAVLVSLTTSHPLRNFAL